MFPQLAHIPNDLISYFLTGKAISNNVAGLLWFYLKTINEFKACLISEVVIGTL